MCPVTPPQRRKPVRPAWKAGLEMDPTVMTVRDSLDQTTTPPQPSPVMATAGDGGDAARAGAQENWVQRCPVTPRGGKRQRFSRSRPAWRWNPL